MGDPQKRMACDECGATLRLVHVREQVDFYDLDPEGQPPEDARAYIEAHQPDDGEVGEKEIEVECSINYGHPTGWAWDHNDGAVRRVEELTNDGP